MKCDFDSKVVAVSVGFLVLGTGCGSDLKLNQLIPTSVQVVQATAEQCQNGGELIRTFRDRNADGVFQSEEQIVSEVPVCNGANGAQGAPGEPGEPGTPGAPGTPGPAGYSAGIQVTAANQASCPAGGSVLTTFMDSNRNSALDSAEQITSISTICNGTPGQDGEDGSDGASAYLTVTPATPAQCPAGGAVYASSIDGGQTQQTLVCNGVNGNDGADGSNATFSMGAIGPQVPGKPYTACHHDYVYLPGTAPARGWLILRHQQNGDADQGIGNTGFQVWNVDISDFVLASEVGHTTYCELHWDPSARTLDYKVVDRTDGLAGLTGTIRLESRPGF